MLGDLVTMATVKVSEKTYQELNVIAGELRARYGRPVSVDEAIEYATKRGKLRASDLAGSWSMSDEEAAKIAKELEGFWARWKLRDE